MRTFTYSDVKSHKFWNIELRGKSFTVTYGRIGTAGQSQTKQFKDDAAAKKEHDKLVNEKLAKGYVETTPSAKPKTTDMREALEAALVENPDDTAAHAAYADYLQEQGDPRGEFIRVQLELEGPGKSPAERKKLQEQEAKLLRAHEREWLGGLADHFLAPKPKKPAWDWATYQYQFRRGWLDSVQASRCRIDFTRALARAPEIRLLRRLAFEQFRSQEPGEYDRGDDPIPEDSWQPAPYALLRSPYLGNVRVLQYGEEVEEDGDELYFNSRVHGEALAGLVKLMPRLEELYVFAREVDADQVFDLRTLDNLRILQVYHTDHYPLQKLAKNPSLGRLTHLLCHPHALQDNIEDGAYIRLEHVRAVVRSTTLKSLTHLRLRQSDMGDKGCTEIVKSGILKRLEVLDLRNGCVTDKGARALAECPELRSLESLDLTRNCLTAAGIAILQATGVQVRADNQWQPTGDEYADSQYLFEGDCE